MAEPNHSHLQMTSDDGTYVNRLTVIFRAIDHLTADSDIGPSVVLAVDPSGRGLNLEPLSRELERLARGPGDEAR